MNSAMRKGLVVLSLAAHLATVLQYTCKMTSRDVPLWLDLPTKINQEASTLFSRSRNESFGVSAQTATASPSQLLNALDLKSWHPTISLAELINTDPNAACTGPGPPDRALVNSTIIEDSSVTHPPNRRIPRTVHVTSRTRCMPGAIRTNLDRWRLHDHSLYVHDDAAVDRLLWETYWPEFPHLNLLRPCMISGAAKADLWR